jgi:pyruvate dehydrogenase E1 component
MGGAVWRKRLMDDLGDQGDVTALIERRSDDELADLMENLGGNCVTTMADVFDSIDHDRPTCFLAYTVKGWGTPIAGHKDNHGGVLTSAQIDQLRADMGIAEGEEWEPMAGLSVDQASVSAFLEAVPFNAAGTRRFSAPAIPTDATIKPRLKEAISTQEAFGQILQSIVSDAPAMAERIVTTSPDVSVSTNLGPWINKTGLFAKADQPDVFRDQAVPSTQKWRRSTDGRLVELGIAENNLFTFLGALGLSHSLFGERLLPVGTVYDPFICRGLDALNYACYQDARFMLVATPSGVSLSHEGGAHQSISTPMIGMAQDGLAAFEPAFADELLAIMQWSFDYMQRDRPDAEPEANWLRDKKGGSVYLRLSTVPVDKIQREQTPEFTQDVIDGGYWLRKPDPGTQLAIAYTGVMAPEAIKAAGLLSERMRGLGVLAITSADRLNAGWQAAERARQRGVSSAISKVETLLADLPGDAGLVTVTDAHPAGLSWLGGVWGHRVRSLGVEHFGQAGTVEDVYRLHRIDADAIIDAAWSVLGRQAPPRQ